MNNITIKQKLKSLHRLQIIHSKIDKINIIAGELPNEIIVLKNELNDINNKIKNINLENEVLKEKINNCLNKKNELKSLLAEYDYKIKNVVDDNEFNELSKLIDINTLDIQISDKRVYEYKSHLIKNDAQIEKYNHTYKIKCSEITEKQSKLDEINKDTFKEKKNLKDISLLQEKNINISLLKIYNKLRSNHKNGLAIVTVDRESCNGCFNKITPQKQLDIKQYKQYIFCEHCGRILIDCQIDK